MFLIYSVGEGENQVRLGPKVVVSLLVACAVYAGGWSAQRVAEIRREAQFEAELARNLDALIEASDAIAANRAR